MGPNYSGSHILSDLLIRMGLLRMQRGNGNESAEKPKGSEKFHQAGTDFLSTLRHLIPASWRIAVSQTLLPHPVKDKLSLRWLTAGMVWDQTRAFLIANANEGLCPHQPERA